MTAEACFQPFSDRLSRDIRNDLSRSLPSVFRQRSIAPAAAVAENYLTNNLAQCYIDYIQDRLDHYSRVLKYLPANDHDPLYQGLVLWDEQLFFEVHEILEHVWLHSEGEEKLFLQAMIRAAGVYIKLEAGYPEPAARMAAKAVPILSRNRHRLSPYIEPDILIDALKKLTPKPPILLHND